MSSYAEAIRDLDAYLAARVPLIGVRTMEQQRALRMIKEVANSPRRAQLPFWIHSRAVGVLNLRTNQVVQEDRSFTGALDFAASQFSRRSMATLVFVDPSNLVDDNPASRYAAELGRLADTSSGTMVLVTDAPLWSGLQRLGMNLRLDPPNADEMYEIVTTFLRDNAGTARIEWSEQDARRAAEFLVGVAEGTAINVLATLLAGGSLVKADLDALVVLKDKHFGALAGLERVVPREQDQQIAGLTRLREWSRRRQQLMVADLRDTNLRPPRGVLLVGVPGCGKSASAKAIAIAWRLPLYRLDLAAILGPYVGQSETRLREALDAADRIAPCVLWIDEIEKAFAGQDDSTGVGRRLLGQFLYWLQESRSRVFVVATCNEVQALPAELLRKGRFDELFFVDLPAADDRREIIKLYYRAYLGEDPAAALADALVTMSAGFSGADIEAALHEVGAHLLVSGEGTRPEPEFVTETFAATHPLSRTDPERIERIRAWGREHAVPAGGAA